LILDSRFSILCDDFFKLNQRVQLRRAGFHGGLEEARGFRQQLLAGGEAVAVVAERAERVTQAGPQALRRVRREAHLPRDLVCRLEADAPDVLRQPVGIAAHNGDGFVAVLLVNLTARLVLTPWLCRKSMISLICCCSPRAGNEGGALRADAGDFAQEVRVPASITSSVLRPK
jgi:hypothetical protein